VTVTVGAVIESASGEWLMPLRIALLTDARHKHLRCHVSNFCGGIVSTVMINGVKDALGRHGLWRRLK
jgi:hypothetical protein